MNNIYKVIWSKAKNCYVVASEIARSHTKSASGSEKIGGDTRRKLLASLMALSLLCGGLGVAEASVHVNENTGGAYEVLTKQEVTDELNKKVSTEVADLKYAKASDVVTNTGNIATNTANINKLDTEKLDKDVANSTFATKDALNDLEAVVNNKMDESAVETALEVKADKATTLEGYGITDAYTKGDVDNKLNEKADAANVFTKDQTYTRDQVNTKLADYAKTTDVNTALAGKANVGDSYTKAEADGQITTAKNELGDKITANTTKIDANKTAIDDLKTKAATTETTLTDLSGRMAAAESDIGTLKADVSTAKSDIGTLKADMTTAKSDIGTLKADVSTAKSDINSLKMKDTELTGKIEAEIANRITSDTALDNKIDAEIANRITSDTALDNKIDAEIANRITSDTALDNKIDTEIQDRKDAIKATNDRTGGIARNLEGTQTTIEGIVKVDNQGNVKNVKNLGAETITTTGNAAIGGELGVTGATTLNGTLTAKGDATFKEKVTVEKDLTVNGKLNVGEIYLKNDKLESTGKKHDSATSITADGISNLAKVTDHGHTTESQFTHNEKGTINYAKDGDTTDWTETRSDVTANGVSNKMKDSAGNRHTYSQTATESKEQLVNGDKSNFEKKTAEGNTISIKDKDADGNYKSLTNKQTVDGEKTSVTNKESSSTINQGADQIRHNVTSADGKKSSIEVKADGITNTSKDGTITNDAKDIVNNATGDMTNTVGSKLTTTVTGQATENFNGGLDTNVTGKENHTVTGDQNIHVTGKQTNEIGGDQENTIGGNQTTTVKGNVKEDYKKDLTTTVGGNELHEVTGTKTENVTGKVTENYGNGQETNVTGDQNIHVTENQTNTIDGNQENTIGGNQTTTVTGDISNTAKNITNEATTKLTDKVGANTRVLDGEGITDTVGGSTFKQRIDAIMGNVKTADGESEVTQKGDEINSVVGKGKPGNSRVTQKKGSIEAVVTDGTSFNHSRDIANASAKTLTGYNKMNQLLDDLNSSTKTITNGTYTTSKVQTALDITNTAADGTITNDAKNIVNNATGDMTNTVGGKLTTTVTGQATENFKGGLKTDITGEEIHTVTGNQTNKVTGKQTNTVEGGQENIISGGQINNITGDQTTTISGTQTTTATDINRNASSGMIDTIDNAYGTNTETKVAGKTTTDVSIKGTGEKGQYIRGANESRDYLIKGTLKNSETKTAEATSTKITDGNGKTSSTIQDVTQISGSVTDGTNTSVSNVKANSIDSAVTDGSSISTINQKKNSITSQVTDGTTITKTEQDTKNITNTAKDGTITNDAKDIVNNASGNMTNTVGGDLTTTVSGNELHEVTGKQTNKIDGDQENTIGGNQTTIVTGDISNKAENITNEANTKLTDKVGENTRVLDSKGITDTVGGSTFKQRIDKIMMESKDVSIKAEETLTNEAKVITNKASEVINNEAVNINNTATGIITSKASEIKNQADKLISNKVGENTWENMENGKITTSIKDGAKQNLTQSDAAGTTQSTVDGGKSTVTIQNADGLADAVTDGTNTSVQNQTTSAIAAAVKDGAGNENASVANATTSVNTIKSGSKANTVISTADGTSFINSEAAAPVGDGTEVKTTIKGNTITTGKVTMDYAEVMKDLGVRGNANIAGKTTTGSLEVKGESKLTGDVTMESNATVKKDLNVKGDTNLKNTKVDGTLDVTQKANFGDSVSIAKDLSVGGNATITGDVTASSYKVGDKTYISAAGINANDQKITNVADGSISEGSKDAVNGGQLYTVKNDFEGKVNKVGANAAAMANLHPMEFDPDSKWNIAAAIGNYGSETAAALGAFYRPNDDVMVNLSTAFGTGENMVGGGVSVRLGKGGNKLSREETNALKAQVADLTARMDALLSVLNPNMSKDFPDVPENHWAYEAVSRLAGNDIVQGYPDGEFHGERTMTRYEMAEIIYNALSRGAEAEKELVEEFKPELQAMAASEKATAEKAEG